MATPPLDPTRRDALRAMLATTALGAGCAAPPPIAPTAPMLQPPRRLTLAPLSLPASAMPPAAPREFRGAWIASVANIDWPPRRGQPVAEQRAAMVAALDAARGIGLNALLLQVRPSADALYPSTLEPWSEFLTGLQGRAPEPFWDPLAEWLAGAQARGIELHAWLNPYRARSSTALSPPAALHVTLRRPDLVRTVGDQLWLDPAEPDAAALLLAVVRDLLQRYALDGLHIDDYFYPYPVKGPDGRELDFPDDAAWVRYLKDGGTLARADWRRGHVDALVRALHRESAATRPGTRFSVSPFGLMRPSLRPPGITGFSQYDKLHADVERWLAEGWLDMLVPQLYWPIAQRAQAFGVLLDRWLALNPRARHVWPGLYTSRLPAPGAARSADAWAADEIVEQIALTRSRGVAGHVHFSLVALLQDRDGIATRLRNGAYAGAALPPATPWVAAAVPAAPTATLVPGADGRPALVVAAADATRCAVWLREAAGWRFAVQPAGLPLPLASPPPDAVVASAVARNGVEGPRVAWSLRPAAA